jgi:bacterioferritin-associated ferredoxin
MWICLCKSVSDRQIRQAIRAGAQTVEDLSRMTEAGTDCGDCLPALRELLVEAGVLMPEPASHPDHEDISAPDKE